MAAPVWRARPQLEHLAQQDEGDDDRGRLEVHAHLTVGIAQRGREQPGATVATTL
jgi:hypothetical protein